MAKLYPTTAKTVLCTTVLALGACSDSGIQNAAQIGASPSSSAAELSIPEVVPLGGGSVATSSTDSSGSPVVQLGAANPNVGIVTVATDSSPEVNPAGGSSVATSSTDSSGSPIVQLGAANPNVGIVIVPTDSSPDIEGSRFELGSAITSSALSGGSVTSVQEPSIEAAQPSEVDLEVETVTNVVTPSAENPIISEVESGGSSAPVAVAEFAATIVDYNPALIAPVDGETLPFGQSIQLVWSVPLVLLEAATSYEVAVVAVDTYELVYRTNLVSNSDCSNEGQCSVEILSADVDSVEGDKIWSVKSTAPGIDSDIVQATFSIGAAPVASVTDSADVVEENLIVEAQKYSDDFIAIKAEADAALADFDNWYVFSGSILNTDQGYHSKAAMNGLAQLYRLTDDPAYMDLAVRLGRKWIDSGRRIDDDEYLDWYGGIDSLRDLINLEHHEWRAADGISDILVEMERTGYEGVSGTKEKFVQFLRQEVWDKWTYGHDIHSAGRIRSSRGSLLSWFAGRWAVIAMGLDKTHATPGDNEYATYINSTFGPYTESAFGTFFPTFIQMEADGVRKVPWWTNNDSRFQNKADSSHAGDIMYAILRAKQLGYDPGGLIDETLAVYERLLNEKMFVTAAGFSHYTDGTGAVNASNWSSAHGHSLSAAFSPELKERWVDYFRYNNPQHNSNPVRVVWMAGGLLWALDGGEL